jgi:O-antigen ligase
VSRFKPKAGVKAAESVERRLFPQTRFASFGSSRPPTAIPILVRQTPAASPRQTAVPEKLAFGLNMLFLFLVTSRLIELLHLFSSMHLVVIISVAAGLIGVLNGTVWKTLTSPLGVLFLCITIWFAITVPLSVWRGGSAATFSGQWLKSVCMFFLVGSATVNSRQALIGMRVSAYSYLACGVVALTMGVVSEGRLGLRSGSLANPNYLAATMCTGVFLWWFIVRNSKAGRLSRVIGVGALAILVAVMVKTGSRGALFALLATIPFLIMQYPLAKRLWIAGGLATLALLGLMVAPDVALKRFTLLFAADQPARSELELRVQESAVDSSAVRLNALKRSLEITGQHPLTGVGIGMFSVAEDQLSKSEGLHSMWLGTHNTYTQVSSETGILGLILFLAILVTDWRTMRSLRRERRLSRQPDGAEIRDASTALWLILLNTMIYAVFDFFAYSSTIPIFSGLILALSRGASQDLTSIQAGEGPAAQAQSATALARAPALASLRQSF